MPRIDIPKLNAELLLIYSDDLQDEVPTPNRQVVRRRLVADSGWVFKQGKQIFTQNRIDESCLARSGLSQHHYLVHIQKIVHFFIILSPFLSN